MKVSDYQSVGHGEYAGERCQGDPERLWLTSCLMLFQKNLVGKGLSKDSKAHKLAFQHWIEAIDPRHRYGHSLHIYYKEWCKADAGQPFFYWLDVGDGKEIDLKECPRPKLRQQCIKYLGPHYEYIIVEGKIMHCQTGLPLHTNNGEKWIFVMSTAKKLYAGEVRFEKKNPTIYDTILFYGKLANGLIAVDHIGKFRYYINPVYYGN
ncbi:putative IQ domain-containing protein IQM [Helianthus annuus]|nr:putative IQ domain-containing protein IQM [Helianthus annuus]